MQIQVMLTREPVPLERDAQGVAASDGALVEFFGIVRGTENGKPIDGLRYEAYEPMAIRECTRILEQLAPLYSCTTAYVVHRVGDIRVGEAAIRVSITAPHRKGAFELLQTFMDRLKEDVPIWKAGVIHRGETDAGLGRS